MDITFFLLLIRYSFIFVFLFTLWDLFKHRDRPRVEIALMFASVASIMMVLTSESTGNM